MGTEYGARRENRNERMGHTLPPYHHQATKNPFCTKEVTSFVKKWRNYTHVPQKKGNSVHYLLTILEIRSV